ncbi:Hemolysin A [Candidatus Regiella insecticola 5.15]|uniref:Hemolysin A n=1 Tax=Candidatus Regiella insecticola 5.15 TaxID=1005043 RepID=G2GXI6_9ENTR|nr:hemagglutinin repeat-containing protein [Candidatus Regiella insecticola]EGY29548.1 Hemolysin A [Candidatus Regiella insecticola 5.15]
MFAESRSRFRKSYLDEHHKISGRSGGGGKITTTTHDSLDQQSAQGSSLSGDSVKVTAGNDLLVQGSDIAGTQDVNLLAGRDLNISSATERYREKHFKEEKKSGFMSSGGIGFSYGQHRVKSTQMTEGLSHKSSTLGSVDGKLTLDAGNEVAVSTSDLIAGDDILLSGKNINITAA